MEIKNYEQKFKESTGLEFNKYYNVYYKKLVFFIKKFGINEIDAESIANEAFIKSIDKIDQYDVGMKYGPWLYQIAKNLTLQFINSNKKTVLVDYNSDNDDEFESSQNALKFHINKKNDNINDNISYDNIMSKKYEATLSEIQKLNNKYKTIIIMRDIQGHTYEYISESLNMSLQTIKNRLHHGRLKLKRSLKYKFEKIYENY